MSTIPKFSAKTLKFIEKASRQKNPNWLEKHRDEYQNLLQLPLQHLARHLKSKLGPQVPDYHFPQKGIGRLKRSALRAQDNQGIFKDWVSYSASRPRTSRFEHNPNLFFLIQTDDDEGDFVLTAGGLYMPSSKQTRAIREAIAQDATPFDRLFATKSFSSRFQGGFSQERTAVRPPRGFDPQHPRIDWLKLQAFFVWKSYSVREFSSTQFADLVLQDFAQVVKLNALLDLAVSGRWSTLQNKTPNLKKSQLTLDEIEAPRHVMDF